MTTTTTTITWLFRPSHSSSREALLLTLFVITAFINFFMYLENVDKVIIDLTTHISLSDSAHLLSLDAADSSSSLLRIQHLNGSSSNANESRITISNSPLPMPAPAPPAAAAPVVLAAPAAIRNWGCNLMETPLIFVHIGKSGGGTVRARLAASALNYTRSAGTWSNDNLDHSYYPIADKQQHDDDGDDTRSQIRGFFCDKGHPQYRVTPNSGQEKVLFCHAMTPLGQSIACPEPVNWTNDKCKRCDPTSEHCPVVYTGTCW
jgi:hypothetical protein